MQQPDPATLAQLELERSQQSGARWFFWIAAMSLINSLATLSGGNINFVIGLATTQFMDAMAVGLTKAHPDWAVGAKAFTLVVNVVIAGIFVAFGAFAKKKQNWAYILGMVCYGADALLCLLFGDMLMLGFHGFALFCVWGGLQASKKLSALEQAQNAPNPAPSP